MSINPLHSFDDLDEALVALRKQLDEVRWHLLNLKLATQAKPTSEFEERFRVLEGADTPQWSEG